MVDRMILGLNIKIKSAGSYTHSNELHRQKQLALLALQKGRPRHRNTRKSKISPLPVVYDKEAHLKSS